MRFYPSDYYQIDDPRIDVLRNITDDNAVFDYVCDQCITVGALEAGCKASEEYIGNTKHHCLAYVNTVEGRVCNVKYRAVDVKQFTQLTLKDKMLPMAPYNIDCLWPDRVGDATGITLIVTEGEKDCCALLSCGFRYVISTPNGAGAKPETYMSAFREWLRPVTRVVICHDEDEAGYEMMHNVREFFGVRLGRQVSVTRLPYVCKDIAEVLRIYGEDGVRQIIDNAKFPDSPQVVFNRSRVSAIKEVLKGNYDHGYGTGFGPLTDRHLRFTGEGGLIIVTGAPSEGKTSWSRALLCHLMCQRDLGVCFCSFEEPNKDKHVANVVRIAMGTTHPEDMTDEMMDSVIGYLDSRMANISFGNMPPTPNNIIRLCEEVRRRQPVHFLYIDPYLFIERDRNIESETLQIKQVLTTLQSWGRLRNIWIMIVCHPRKLQKDQNGKYETVDQYTIAGSAHWANLADYLLAVKREFVYGSGMEDNGSANPSYTVVNVMKVRDQEVCHTGNLYFMRQPCGRYDERPSAESCKREIMHSPPMQGDVRDIDTNYWIPVVF